MHIRRGPPSKFDVVDTTPIPKEKRPFLQPKEVERLADQPKSVKFLARITTDKIHFRINVPKQYWPQLGNWVNQTVKITVEDIPL